MSNDVTQILVRIDSGDRAAIDELLPKVYENLRSMARQRMAQERCEHTLQATALVNEAYLRLVNPKSPLKWESRGQFFAAAAEAMRRILVEHARSRLRQKRGGDRSREELPTELGDYRLSPTQMLDFNEAIERLAALDPIKAEVVKLRCFAGLDREQLSNALGVSLATVDRHWAFAKVWLYQQLQGLDGTQS
jgi:RNA polymerase sigma factor (TIGR02999 family)